MSTPKVDALFLSFQAAVAGSYSLERELGRGGMGVVYLARDVELDRLVAIKLLPPERAGDDATRARFVREARMAAKLSHPNIIPIFAVDEADGFVFYVMAFVDGETLGERVRARGPLSASEATRVLREIAWALGHAHAQGLVHRDVKPENILLERGTGRALVTDFGIAAAIGSDEGPAVAGTPEYMSPEQAMGGELDARSDLYALGATAYFTVAGRPPFSGARAVDVVAKQVSLPVPPLAAAGSAVPRKLAHLIERCLEKEPALRPAGALVLAEQLGAAVDQRKEIPAVLRSFVKRDSRFVGPGSIVIAYLVTGMMFPLFALAGATSALSIVLLPLVVIPFGGMVLSARKLVRRGFALPDVRMAFDHEIDTLREEFHAEGRAEYPAVERAALVTTVVSAATTIGSGFISYQLAVSGAYDSFFGAVGSFAGLLAVASGITLAVLRRRRPHSAAETWSKLWMGRLGRAAFKIAEWFGAKPAAGVASTHRATEMALGMAAEDLYRTLPKETRRAIGDVPKVVVGLQRDATTLRAALDKLNDALSDAGDRALGSEYAEARAMRDQVAERHRQVIAALETTRLDLLRLHAGAIKVDGFTTRFDEAGEIAVEVRRLLEARGELERFLRFPAPPRVTPA